MPMFSESLAQARTPQIQRLIDQAQAGQIGQDEFLNELDRHQFGDFLKIYLLCQGFNLDYPTAKGYFIDRTYGQSEWTAAMEEALAEIERIEKPSS